MKPGRFTEEQIIGILREQEAGAKTADVCRKYGISSATFYKWKGKYAVSTCRTPSVDAGVIPQKCRLKIPQLMCRASPGAPWGMGGDRSPNPALPKTRERCGDQAWGSRHDSRSSSTGADGFSDRPRARGPPQDRAKCIARGLEPPVDGPETRERLIYSSVSYLRDRVMVYPGLTGRQLSRHFRKADMRELYRGH